VSAPGCSARVSSAYAGRVAAAIRSGKDVWGNRLLAAPEGPSYDDARAMLPPLLYAVQRKRQRTTLPAARSAPLAYPTGGRSPKTSALAAAAGTEIIPPHVTGYHVRTEVGATGPKRYGSCLARTQTATRADGYLPIIDTSYVDA